MRNEQRKKGAYNQRNCLLSTTHVLIKTKTCADAQILYILTSHYGGGGGVRNGQVEKWQSG